MIRVPKHLYLLLRRYQAEIDLDTLFEFGLARPEFEQKYGMSKVEARAAKHNLDLQLNQVEDDFKKGVYEKMEAFIQANREDLRNEEKKARPAPKGRCLTCGCPVHEMEIFCVEHLTETPQSDG